MLQLSDTPIVFENSNIHYYYYSNTLIPVLGTQATGNLN